MRLMKLPITVLAASALLLTACGGGNTDEETLTKEETKAATKASPEPKEKEIEGEKEKDKPDPGDDSYDDVKDTMICEEMLEEVTPPVENLDFDSDTDITEAVKEALGDYLEDNHLIEVSEKATNPDIANEANRFMATNRMQYALLDNGLDIENIENAETDPAFLKTLSEMDPEDYALIEETTTKINEQMREAEKNDEPFEFVFFSACSDLGVDLGV